MTLKNNLYAAPPAIQRPDTFGRFGQFGGKYVPETLMPALSELETAFQQYRTDPTFQYELQNLMRDYVGRPSPLYFAERLTAHYARPDGTGSQIYLKREDLNHTGAHKINNALAQVLLAKRMDKQRIIAETGAGQHGVATATVCARFGLECVIYMGIHDMERQALNVFRMRLMGAEVRPVEAGTGTLKDATSEAIRDWVTNVENTHYILGSVAGPHPYPMMVRDFQSVIGQETRAQCQENSISAGLDYPGVGPEHSYLKELGRAEYYSVTDRQALEAFQRLSQLEGIIPALETAHAIEYLETLCPQLSGSPRLVISCSGRGDKDVQTVAKFLTQI